MVKIKYCDFNSNVLFTKKMLYSLKRSLENYEYWNRFDDEERMLESAKEDIIHDYTVLKRIMDRISNEL